MKKTTMVSQVNESVGRVMTRKGFFLLVFVLFGSVLVACGNLLLTETPGTSPVSTTPFHPEITLTFLANETPSTSETLFVDVTPNIEATSEIPESNELYPTIFELPIEGEAYGIKVHFVVAMTDDFQRYFGFKGAEIARPDAGDVYADLWLKQLWRSWVFDNLAERNNVGFEQWLDLAKRGDGKIMIPAVDENKEGVKIGDLEMHEWGVVVNNDVSELFVKSVFAVDGLPIAIASNVQCNIVINGDTLTMVQPHNVTDTQIKKDYGDYWVNRADLSFSSRALTFGILLNLPDSYVEKGGELMPKDDVFTQIWTNDFIYKTASLEDLKNPSFNDIKTFLVVIR